MKNGFYRIKIVLRLFAVTLIINCKSKETETEPWFEALDSDKTGLQFSNGLKARSDFNMLEYMYFYNGAGLGAGDFNNDGLVDLFFASNQQQNKLYLNKGNLKFDDVTSTAKIPDDGGWSTGVSIADVNDDGLLDIYVCRVGKYKNLKNKNQLLICKGIDKNGIPFYNDEAAVYGVGFSGFSTQAAFLDYDLDGDLDMFLLNHSLRYNSTFAPRSNFIQNVDSLSGDILYRNDGGKFTDVSKQAGILQNVIGYGLGIAVADMNLDGWPDIYIGNDFHENDYLYINNQRGGFTEELTSRTMHTSQFSMGVDVADINNDAWPEIIAADMLPSDPYILRRSLGEDEYNTFQIKIKNGYNHQYARNTLQLNRGYGIFSEIGLYAGIYATDWSWSTLWMDFDNDGLKDLFISNGIPKRLNDIDYVNYVSNDEIQAKIRAGQMGEKDMDLIDKFPQIKLPNRFFRNKRNAAFEDAGQFISNNKNTYSNGAVYADLDNDGDLDIVVNNIDETALLYKNTCNDKKTKPAAEIRLKGPDGNRNAVGAKLILFTESGMRVYEKFPARGFQSSMELPVHIAVPATYDSVVLIWPDNRYQKIELDKNSLFVSIDYKPGLPLFRYTSLYGEQPAAEFSFEDITKAYGLSYLHAENTFVEFDREPLMPFMASQEGPTLAVADINNDKLDDVFIGSSKWEKSAMFVQQPNGKFLKSVQPALDNDSTYEDADACWDDFNNDGYFDLAIAPGGNEYYGYSNYLLPRLYLNDGKGNLTKKEAAFDSIYITASCILAEDFNGDGKKDLFVGGRAVPFEYGTVPRSYILQNNGTGQFTDVTASFGIELQSPGFVKDAALADIDNDGDRDIILALEWDGICAFINENGEYRKQYLTEKKGWWKFILPFDADGDGDIDFIAGNQGLNSRLTASKKEPVRFYYFDTDNNGKKEQVITYYLQAKELPFANKAELDKQIPSIKKKYLYAEDFAKASLRDIFGAGKLKKALKYEAVYFSNALFMNNGKGSFTVKELPWQAQLTSYTDAVLLHANNDSMPDILLTGNFYANNIQMGRYDADYGTVLLNKGNGNFKYNRLPGLYIKGEARSVKSIKLLKEKHPSFLIARNNDSLLLIRQR